MSPQDMRATLIARTIQVIADEGLDKTTTKSIVSGTGINEAYIYRLFDGKEDLLSKTFDNLDNELVEQALTHLSAMYLPDFSFEERCRMYFFPMWRFLLCNREKCVAYIRYFYSPYFQRLSAESHRHRYDLLLSKFRPSFIDEADVWMILNHILDVMLCFAIRVHTGEMPADDSYGEHVFRVTYVAVKQYFKPDNESEV